jgi:hypothetical protein
MTIETDFPSLTREGAAATAEDIAFYQDGYEMVVNRMVAARGPNEFLGQKPSVCRFCLRTAPEVTFRKEAHAIPELAGNGTLISLYECDDCNARFSAFEDDLGKLTLLERIAGQVLGKSGVPSAKTGQKRSRIDVDLSGFKIEEHEDDPIAEIDHEAKTLTITIPAQRYRPLGVFKALLKVAITFMDEHDLPKAPEALRWLRAADLTTDQVDDGTRYTCLRTFTPGPAPFASTRAVLLRRKRPDVLGPTIIFVLAFGNLSFQIVVPSPQEDRHLIGKTISLRPVPVFAFQDKDRVRGPTRFWKDDLSSRALMRGPPSVVFHFDEIQDTLSAAPPGPEGGPEEETMPENTPQEPLNSGSEIEKLKLEIEKQKLSNEVIRTKWTIISIGVSSLSIIATIVWGVYSLGQQAKSAFQLEAAKAVMAVRTYGDQVSQASFLRENFPEQLGESFFPMLDIKTFPDARNVSAKMEFMKLIVSSGLNAEETAKLYNVLYPDDKWAQTEPLQTLLKQATARQAASRNETERGAPHASAPQVP